MLSSADQGLPAPPSFAADVDPTFVLILFASFAAASFAYAVLVARRSQDCIPLFCCAGALVASLNEPIYDILGKIVYATDNAMAFEAFGRNVPWFLVLGYVPWVGLAPYLVFRAMKRGVPRRVLHLAAMGLFVTVMAVETFGNALHLWTYYGEAPMKYLGVAPQAVTYPLVGGFLLLALADSTKGWRRGFSAFVIALLILPIGYAATSWPIYFALHSDLPRGLDWLAVATFGLLLAALAGGSTLLAERWSDMAVGQGLARSDAPSTNVAPTTPGSPARRGVELGK